MIHLEILKSTKLIRNSLLNERTGVGGQFDYSAECLQKVHEHFCSIYRPNIDPHFEKYVAIIDQNHKVSEKYELG